MDGSDEKYLKDLRDYYYSFCDSLKSDASASLSTSPPAKVSSVYVIQTATPAAERVASPQTYLDTVTCMYCGKSYKGRYNLRCHVFTSHWTCFFECSYSGCLTFHKDLGELHAHLAGADGKHTGRKNYSCTDCGVPFENVQAMNQHKLWHHPTFAESNGIKNAASQCPVCQLVTSVSIMKQHQQKRRCENCNTSLTCSFLYYQHIAECKRNDGFITLR